MARPEHPIQLAAQEYRTRLAAPDRAGRVLPTRPLAARFGGAAPAGLQTPPQDSTASVPWPSHFPPP